MTLSPSALCDRLPLEGGGEIIRVKITETNLKFPKQELNRNVFRVDGQGQIIWRVAYHEIGPSYGADAFVNVRWGPNRKLLGTKFSGFEFEIGIEDGSLKLLGWTK